MEFSSDIKEVKFGFVWAFCPATDMQGQKTGSYYVRFPVGGKYCPYSAMEWASALTRLLTKEEWYKLYDSMFPSIGGHITEWHVDINNMPTSVTDLIVAILQQQCKRYRSQFHPKTGLPVEGFLGEHVKLETVHKFFEELLPLLKPEAASDPWKQQRKQCEDMFNGFTLANINSEIAVEAKSAPGEIFKIAWLCNKRRAEGGPKSCEALKMVNVPVITGAGVVWISVCERHKLTYIQFSTPSLRKASASLIGIKSFEGNCQFADAQGKPCNKVFKCDSENAHGRRWCYDCSGEPTPEELKGCVVWVNK